MKIGIACPYDLARSGGVQEHVLTQAQELQRRGHQVIILTPRVRHQAQSPKGAPPIIYVGSSTKVKTPVKTSLEVGLSLNRDQLDEILAKEQFDIIHIHEPEVPILGAQIAAKASCPIVATFHATLPRTPMGRTISGLRGTYSRAILARLSKLTAVSDPAATFVRQQTGRPVQIIPNGIDLTKYEFAPQPSASKKTILYIGRLEKRKGLQHLLKAYALLCQSRTDVELQLAGDGELRSGLEDYVRAHQIPRVKFLGFVSEAQKLRLLKKADLFCSPALYGESFGIVLLEAMASGTVIVAGDNPGYASVLRGLGSLSLVNPKHSDELARRIALLLDERPLRDLWLNWAKTYIQQFDYPKIVDQYEHIYKSCLPKS